MSGLEDSLRRPRGFAGAQSTGGSIVIHRLMQTKTMKVSAFAAADIDWEEMLVRRMCPVLGQFAAVEAHLSQLRSSPGVTSAILDLVLFCRLMGVLRASLIGVDWVSMRRFRRSDLTSSHQLMKHRRRVGIYLDEIGPIAERVRDKSLQLTREYLIDQGGTPRRRVDLQMGYHLLYKKVTYVYHQWLDEIELAAGESGLPAEYLAQLRGFEGDVAGNIRDPAGAAFWSEKVRGYLVSWKDLKNHLEIYTQREIHESLEAKMRGVMDFASTGLVNVVVFNDFLCGFGPFDGLVDHSSAILFQPWFHGYASLQEATRLLDAEQPGSFLVRLRDCYAGGFAIAFVHPENRDRLVHVAVENAPIGGFLIKQGDRDLQFKTFADIIRTYGRFLRQPLMSRLNDFGWFYGDISGREATELLQGQTVASFIVRFSQGNPNCLATAYVASDGKIVHSLIEKSASGYHHGTDPAFPSIEELLQAYQAVLSFPFISGNSWYDQLALRISSAVDQAAALRAQRPADLDSTASEQDLSSEASMDEDVTASAFAYPIPLIAEQCILCLCDRKNGATPDLFVASRSAQEVAEVKQFFEKNIDVDIWTYHPQIVAQTLKVYLREMPRPLIPEPLFDSFLSIKDVTPISMVQPLLASLPPESASLLTYLLRMCTQLLLDSAKNKLTALTLAQQLGPNILRRHDLSMEESLAVTDAVYRSVKYLISQAALLIPDLDKLQVDGIYMDNLVLTPNRQTIKSGTLERIVSALFENVPGGAIRSATYGAKFRLTYQSFMSSQQLLRMLQQKYVELDQDQGAHAKVQRQKIVSFVAKWLGELAVEFLADLQFKEILDEFIGQVSDPMLKKHLGHSLEKMNRPITKVYGADPPAPKKLPKKIGSCIDVPSLEMARQLTVMMYELYARIRPSELVEIRWQKGDDAEKQARAGNVLAVIAQYNKSVMWVVSELLQAKNRSKMVSHFLAMADDFRSLNNFNGLFAIVSAFSNASIARLHEVKSLKKGEEMKLHELNAYLNSAGNYKYYRDAVKKANPPILPYLGTFLTDLLMIQEGNKLMLENGHINFRKCYATSIVIQNVQQYQLSSYNFVPVAPVTDYFNAFKPLTDDEAWARSQQVQPSTG
jgi:hypothetical protein